MADITDDMNLFDSVISGEGAGSALPDPEVVKPQEPVRDETGKFAKAEVPTVTTPVVETPTQPVEEGPVPVAAVQDERRKRQEAERRAQELEARLAALEATKPATPVEPVVPASIWDNPEEWHKNQLTPIEKQLAETRELILEMRAEAKHGEKLSAAKTWMESLTDDNVKRNLASEVFSGGNPFDNLVNAHARQQVLARVGTDPEAFLAAEREKLLADPTFQAQVLERARATAVGNGRANAPRTSLPSLSSIPSSGAGNAAAEPQDDSSLFSSITSARRK